MVSCNIKKSIIEHDLQMSILENTDIVVVNVYRSHGNTTLAKHLRKILPIGKTAVVCGDFNFCFVENHRHEIRITLENMGYCMIHDFSTHLQGGHLDQVWVRLHDKNIQIKSEEYSPYYTCKDHDAALITIFKEGGKQNKQISESISQDDRRSEAKKRIRMQVNCKTD